jgi:apolipoprotein N-acyltransferase
MKDGAEILVLVSNTSWFGRTRASYQHARFDVYRAVENRTWFCRASTTGVTSVIDPYGRVLEQTELFKADAITVPVGLRTQTTIYTLLGDWVPALCGIFILILLLGAFLLKPSLSSNN